MGTDITLFLEFYGLPGCGKSTISHLVAEELRKQGKNVVEPTYDTDHRYARSVRKAIKLLKLIRYALLCPSKYRALAKMIKANGHVGADVLSQAANIAPKLWEYDHASVDYVVFDEGLIQSAISLVNNENDDSENERLLFSLCKNRAIRKFYIKVETDTALARMVSRESRDSRIEKISDECERIKALKGFERQCESISADIIIDKATKEESVEKILMQLYY